MDYTASWFLALSLLGALGYFTGFYLGNGPARRSWAGLFLGLALVGLWAFFKYEPTVAVHALPVWVLSHIEGVGAVPFYMLVIGIAWARSRLPRQRRVVLLGLGMGMVYFLNGGIWMMQSTPATALANTAANRDGVIRQSQDFTCVPAACATALNRIGIATTEAEMAILTGTRPGTGSTLIRAFDGLAQMVEGRGYTVELLKPSFQDLTALPMPALTALKFQPGQRHMVVLLEVYDRTVAYFDPQEGLINVPRVMFDEFYDGQVIVFRKSN